MLKKLTKDEQKEVKGGGWFDATIKCMGDAMFDCMSEGLGEEFYSMAYVAY